MATTTTQTQTPCIIYKVNVDNSGAPIVGTMQSSTTNFKVTSPCQQVILPNYQITVPDGHSVCRFPNHMRYFYKIDSVTSTVLPNSLFSLPTAPPTWCVGNERILEYLKWL